MLNETTSNSGPLPVVSAPAEPVCVGSPERPGASVYKIVLPLLANPALRHTHSAGLNLLTAATASAPAAKTYTHITLLNHLLVPLWLFTICISMI